MRPEILAPAGSMEAMKAAVHAGADAVYLGGDKFGARAYANNFDGTALIEAIEYCHLYGVKVYLTINTLFRNEEICELYEYLAPLYKAGLDAVIVQDFGVMSYVHQYFPDLPIHASTQMTITTKYAYDLIKDYGVTRIVPARELSIEEIADLKKGESAPEVEVFVQGALCYCYSGQCLMSSMIGGRSGNRGRCAQTCRLPYSLQEEDGTPVKHKGDYLLSPKDLCGLESIPALVKAGVDSFKIEGRMKRPEYVAACVRAYRKLLDAWYSGKFSEQLVQKYKTELAAVFNRGSFTEGYYNQKNGKQMMSTEYPGNVGVTIGEVVSVQKNQVSIRLEKDIYKGDILVILNAQDEITLTSNVEGKKGKTIVLNAPKAQKINKGISVNRISLYPLMKELEEYVEQEPKVLLKGNVWLLQGENATISLEVDLKGQKYSCVYTGEQVESASAKPLTKEVVEDKLGKLGNTRYVFEELTIDVSANAFYSLKALKDLRRNAIEELELIILKQSEREDCSLQEDFTDDVIDKDNIPVSSIDGHGINTVMVSSEEQYKSVMDYDCFDWIYLDIQHFSEESLKSILHQSKKHQCAIVLPPIIRKRYLQDVENIVRYVMENHPDTGIVVRNIDGLALISSLGFKGQVITDYSVYAMNDIAAGFIRSTVPNVRITLPVELNAQQIKLLQYTDNNCEQIVYGYQQLMVSAQCLQNTVRGCDKKGAHFSLKDRYLKNFFILSVCKYCYNLIYNGIPTVLFDLVGGKDKKSVVKRIHFTIESGDEVKRVVEAFLQEKDLQGEKTRGHYKRGVE
ncbi:MAG: U32 family peptidase [Lachnospiraceae bacterium]|nr:U32 family peptidase [Lachnospiraceae bacterium]